MKIFTIGLGDKSAEEFFWLLRGTKVASLIDVRRDTDVDHRFAHGEDLRYLLAELCDIGYSHHVELAPTAAMATDYLSGRCSWRTYEEDFLELLDRRGIAARLDVTEFENAALMCTTSDAERCHRRLVAEYLAARWQGAEVHHLA